MTWPLSQDYNEAIQNPQTSFSDAELRGGQAAVNALGMPLPCSGNFADVYRVHCPANQRSYAVKCFTRQIPGLRERYQQISLYLEQVKLPFMVGFTFLDKGIQVRGDWYPILKMEWAEGMPLNQLVKNHLDKPQLLDKLCQMWIKLASRLREANLAHCDLQHGNVLLVPGSKTGALGLKLVDYDGMCVPALTQLKSLEVGHPSYQHPQRLREGIYSLEVDRFSHLTIYTALRGLLAGGKELWERYDNGDNLLFCQDDFKKPHDSKLLQELSQSPSAEVRRLTGALKIAAGQTLEKTPLLDELLDDEPTVVTITPAQTVKRSPQAVTAKVPASAKAAVGLSVDQSDESLPISDVKPWHQRPAILASLGCLGGALLVGVVTVVGFIVYIATKSDPNTGPDLAGVSTTSEVRKQTPPAPLETSGQAKKLPAKTHIDPVTKPDPTQTFEIPDKENKPDIPPPIIKKPPPAKTPETDPVESTWLDLMPLIDPDLHTVAGQWRLDNSGALMSDENILSRLQVPYTPGYEYILKLTVEPVSGTPLFYVGLALPGGKHADVAFSQSYLFSGLDLVAKEIFTKNETARKGAPFLPNQPNEIICTVGSGTIKVDVEGRTLVDWKGGFSRITSNNNLWLPNNKALSVTSQRAGVRITKIAIKPLVGKGTILAGGAADGADIALRKKMLPGLGRLAGTEWLISSNDTLEWNWEGKCFYNGQMRTATGADEKTIRFTPDDNLVFDDKLQTFVQTKGGKTFTGMRLEPGEWFELRISAVLSGTYKMHVTPTFLRWETVGGTAPPLVTLNRNPWNVTKEPVANHADFLSLFGKTVDLTRYRIEKIKGLGNYTMAKGKNALILTLNGTPKDAAKKEQSEVSLWLRVGNARPNPFQLINHFHSNNVPVDLAVSGDGRLAASADATGAVRLWDLQTSSNIWQVGTHVGTPNALCFLDQSKLVAFVGSDGALRFVEAGPKDKVGRMDLQNRTVQSVFSVADKQQLLFSTDSFKIGTVDMQAGKGSDLFTFRIDQKKSAQILAFSANGKRALSSGEDNVTRIWDLNTKTEQGRLGAKNMCECGALSADGNMAATFGRLGHSIQVWDAKSGKLLRGTAPLNGIADPSYLAFSPDGKKLLSVNADGKVYVWNTADCREIGHLGKHPSAIRTARFMPDGRGIIVAEVEGIIRVWRLPE